MTPSVGFIWLTRTHTDTAKNLSSLLGFSVRVGELINRLRGEMGPRSDRGGDLDPEPGVLGKKRRKGGTKGAEPRPTLVPRKATQVGGRLFEYSIHRAEGPVLEAARMAFPDLDLEECAALNLLAVPTFQRAAASVDLNPESGCPPKTIAAEMNKLHLNYIALDC